MTNTVEPLVSPEKLPATSFAAVPFSSPACLADPRVLPVSVAAEAGAQRGPRVLGRAASWAAPVRSWAAVSWASPPVAVRFYFILFCLTVFHSFGAPFQK